MTTERDKPENDDRKSMIRDLLHEIHSTLRQNKLRTALTGFAVSWGIFLLIALLGAGNGLMNSFSGNMQDFISQSVSVSGWRTSMPYAGYKENRPIQMDQRDADYTEGTQWQGIIGNVTKETPSTDVTLALDGHTVGGYIGGVMPEYKEQNKKKMVAGRFINTADLKERRKVIVITEAQAKELSPKEPKDVVGRWIKAGPISYLVIGLFYTDDRDFRRMCTIPYTTYKGIYDSSDKIEAVTFTVDGPVTLEEHQAFQKEYLAGLKSIHEVHPDDPRAFWVQNGYTDNLEMTKASRILSIALWILGILTLISGIVGVSNIMLITVKERTHEFGIRKAIGAKPGNVLTLIISESVTITAIFGYIGMLMGMIACQVMDKTIGQNTVDIGIDQIRMLVNPSVGLDTALEATLLLIVAGTIAGAIPAWKAAKVKPIEALRAE